MVTPLILVGRFLLEKLLQDITPIERRIFEKTDRILGLGGGKPANVRQILISETMRLKGFQEAAGVWEEVQQRIVIKRSQLKSLQEYAGTLLHEMAHAGSRACDVTRGFEDELTRLLGVVTSNTLL
jgi:hypothetical protein